MAAMAASSICFFPSIRQRRRTSSAVGAAQLVEEEEEDLGGYFGANGKAIFPTRAQGIPAAAVFSHRVLQRGLSRRLVLGARAEVVDERDDGTVGRGVVEGVFCKKLMHVYGNQRPVVRALKSDSVCSETKATPSPTGFTVPLHHRHGPCSPLTDKKMPTLAEMLPRDQLRAAHIQRKFSASAAFGGAGDVQQSDATVPTTLGTSLNTLEYVITVGLGSPSVTQTMLIDTGSDVSWVQCKPCSQCHSQADPLFDPTSSSTYSPFSCSSATCTRLGQDGSANGCSSSQCQYIVKYGDGSSTTGTYSSDTLALGSNTVTNFQFGCNQVESGFNDQTDGLMGLGGGAESLVTQTAGRFGSAFSYCLPPTSGSSGFLTLGAGTSGFVKTPMLRSSRVPTFYGVRLQAIRVGGRQLNIPASAFSAGTVMDSGTVITRLPPTAYSALSSAFKAGMKQYQPAPSSGLLDTCFNFNGQTSISIPSVALVFSGGAVVDLDPNGIMLSNCLAFAANSDDSSLGIIGNVQQRTFQVLYDVGGGSVGFKAGAC